MFKWILASVLLYVYRRFLTTLLHLWHQLLPSHQVCIESNMSDRNAPHLQNYMVALKFRLCCCVFGCFRIPTGTEQGTQWAEKAPSQLTMSRKGKESSQEGNSVLCRKYQRGNGVENQHNSVYVWVLTFLNVSCIYLETNTHTQTLCLESYTFIVFTHNLSTCKPFLYSVSRDKMHLD